jgi:hypothetical protein
MSSPAALALPCVVQLGFAGSRTLFNLPPELEGQRAVFELQVEEYLVQALGSLRKELHLKENHFLCGISQIAVGADTIFTRACARANILQRIFLPQPRDVYFAGVGSHGPDFSEAERLKAEKLLTSGHIIQERVVSHAATRAQRFEDCNREILRVSDVLVCIRRPDVRNDPGGTWDFFSLAQRHGKKTLEICVELSSKNEPEFYSKWHGVDFSPPMLPTSIESVSLLAGAMALPSVADFCAAVKQLASAEAKRHSAVFSRAALVVISTHVIATLCATVALTSHMASEAGSGPVPATHWWMPALLAVELVVLIGGFMTHLWLHHAKSLKAWTLSRLLAEINRSVTSLGNLHIYLEYLFDLRLPADLRPLLRTINILHLRSTRPFANDAWETIRDAYVSNRFTDPDPKKGQITFFLGRSESEAIKLRLANAVFVLCSLMAIFATATKFVALAGLLKAPPLFIAAWTNLLGTAAIFLPTLAVGAVSWAAAKEYNARVQSFKGMLDFLNEQQDRLLKATSAQEFHRLVEETESNLLGENVEWYFRTKVIGVP